MTTQIGGAPSTPTGNTYDKYGTTNAAELIASLL